jgi:hypothetical protein
MSNIKTIYHGSINIVKVPLYGQGKINNDYGRGLYNDYIMNDKTARLYFRQLLKESFNSGKTFVRDLLGGR